MASKVKEILALGSEFKGAAMADSEGNVMEFQGEGDAESFCAVAAMINTNLGQLAEQLGMGTAVSWSFSTEKSCLYVENKEETLAVALGTAAKSLEKNLKAMNKVLGS